MATKAKIHELNLIFSARKFLCVVSFNKILYVES